MTKLNKGDAFPSFSFNTAYQNDLNSINILKGRTVFWVLRYIGCTVCRYDVKQIAERYQEFIDKNAQVYVLMQSDAQHVQNDLAKTDTQLPALFILNEDGTAAYAHYARNIMDMPSLDEVLEML